MLVLKVISVSHSHEPTYTDFELPLFGSESLSVLKEAQEKPKETSKDLRREAQKASDSTLSLRVKRKGESPTRLATAVKPWLVVVRGEKLGVAFPLKPGANIIGRVADKSCEICLGGQEAADRIWVSRKHAQIHFEQDSITLEDLNSMNGTFIDRNKLAAGTRHELTDGDVIQIGTVQLRLVFSDKYPQEL